MKFNGLQILRYSITATINDRSTWKVIPYSALGGFTVTMSTTYENLIKKHLEHLENTINSDSLEQVKRNHMAALRSFLRHLNKSETSSVGNEMAEGFDQAVVNHIAASDLAERSKRDRKSILYAWKSTFATMPNEAQRSTRERRSAAVAPLYQTHFEKTLWSALKAKGLPPKRAAILAGVSTSAIGRWSRGALPNASTTGSLERLDVTLGLHKGTLANALEETLRPGKEAGLQNAYRQELKNRIQDKYAVTVNEALAPLIDEWQSLLRYKTAPATKKVKRNKGGKWTTLPVAHSTVEQAFYCSVGTSVCPAADIAWGRTSSFLGFLRRPRDKGGLNLTNEQAQTLAWFAVPEAIEAFFDFITERSDGLKHDGQAGFCTFANMLLHPQNGYLTQHPELASKLPTEYLSGDWTEMCLEARETATSLKNDCNDTSRDPAKPIAPLLALENPLQPIFDAMKKLRRIGDVSQKHSMGEAVARRDELIFGLLVFNPLRINNIITLSYKTDNSGDISRDTSGKWTIRLHANRMKNRKRVAGQTYTVTLPAWLAALVEDYVNDHRKTLLGGKTCDNFFLSSNGIRFEGLAQQFAKQTRTLIPGCSGFRPHAMRHLVATNWLVKNPNDFLTVSELLNDSLEVVMSNYAHLKKDTAFGRYNAQLQELMG